MRKIYIFLLVLMPTLMYSQNNDSASHYTPREIQSPESFEELVKPGHQFFAIALMPFNYYNYSDEISTGESIAGYAGINVAYYLGHSNGRFLKLGLGYSEVSKGTMLFGDNFDNVRMDMLFESDNYKGYSSSFEKEIEDFYISLTENIAYRDFILSFGLQFDISFYNYNYKYITAGTWGNHRYNNFYSQGEEFIVSSLGTSLGMQYCFYDNFAVEMQMCCAAITTKANRVERDYQVSLNLGVNYKIPLQKPKLKYIDGEYIEE